MTDVIQAPGMGHNQPDPLEMEKKNQKWDRWAKKRTFVRALEGTYSHLYKTLKEEKRVYSLTPAGQAALDERLTEGPLPWMNPEAAEGHGAFRQALGQLVMAAKQVANSGNPQLIESAATILNDARRKLYQLLAEA